MAGRNEKVAVNELVGRIAAVLDGKGDRLWTRDFILTLITGHFMFAGYTATLTIIPPFAVEYLKGDASFHLPIIIGAFGIVGLLIRPVGGQWIYTLGPKRVAVIGTAIVALGSLSYIFALSPWWLMPMRMLQGVGLALGPVATSTMVANLAPNTRRAEAMAYMGNAINISFLYSPFVASFLYDNAGPQNAFLFSALAAAIGTLACLRISASRIGFERPAPGPAAGASGDKPPLIARSALFPTLVFLTYTFTTAPTNTYLPLLAHEQSLGNPGLYYTVFSVVSMFAMAAGGPIADRLGRATVIVPGLLSVAIAMFVLNGAFFQAMFLSGGFFAGLGFGLLQPGIQSFTVDRAPMRERSAAMATLQQAWDVGGSFGAFVFIPIHSFIGTSNTFGITGIGALIGMLGFIIGNAKSRTKLPEQAAAGD
ncbi:MAG: MFS transporter [Chloroflexota bacterium]|nr:MFS transporter [Chloroflexota bacterium]MDE2687664.1 MFS transporter [Chloroflexota bacterium]